MGVWFPFLTSVLVECCQECLQNSALLPNFSYLLNLIDLKQSNVEQVHSIFYILQQYSTLTS